MKPALHVANTEKKLTDTHARSINIAIDGYAGCGKSSTAREIAKRLGYIFVDTGAMYRAVTLYFLDHNIPFDQESPKMLSALDDIQLDFVQPDNAPHPIIRLNGKIAEPAIREARVAAKVSEVSVHPSIRRKVVQQQQEMARNKGVVMEGRDIGTVVMPSAELKFFMTASPEVRAQRRQKEMLARGEAADLDSILDNLKHRDKIDSGRKVSPLKQAEDATVIDTSNISFDEQVEMVMKIALDKIAALNASS
ncbi:MAG: (d)CMP kinase [Bacteroidota bacterium]